MTSMHASPKPAQIAYTHYTHTNADWRFAKASNREAKLGQSSGRDVQEGIL